MLNDAFTLSSRGTPRDLVFTDDCCDPEIPGVPAARVPVATAPLGMTPRTRDSNGRATLARAFERVVGCGQRLDGLGELADLFEHFLRRRFGIEQDFADAQ